MSNIQREHQIMELLKELKYADVNHLANTLFTSPSSIRRDIRNLEDQGLVKRSHGGVSLITAQPGMAPFNIRLHENKREKITIIRKAVKLIQEGSSIFIDSSTTSLNFASFLSPEMNLTVFTNNIRLAHLLAAKQIETYCVGGQVSQQNDVVTTGGFALHMLSQIYVDMFFFTSAALSADGVITDHNESETAIRKMMLSHSKQTIFLCPHDRFPLTATFKVAELNDINYVVTDAALSDFLIRDYDHLTFI